MTPGNRIAGFRGRLSARIPLIGTFQKTPNAAVTEIIALSGLDCVCVDAEHAPFDRGDLDEVLLAATAHDLPSLVRVPRNDPAEIQTALDLGATGVVVPHVTEAHEAERAAQAARYGHGGRGYAGSPRSAGYGTRSMNDIIAGAAAQTCVVVQIEDASALKALGDIAEVEGIDCLFVGRMDLTVSLGAASPTDPIVVDAVRQICQAGARRGRCVGMFTTSASEALQWRDEGASFFLLGSDQQWVLQGGRDLAKSFRTADGDPSKR